MAKRRKPRNEDEEREFWSKQDSTEIIDWTKAERVSLPELRPSLKTISIRLSTLLLEEIKIWVDAWQRHRAAGETRFNEAAFDAGRALYEGRPRPPLPSFSASMTHVVLNPWWEVPRRLAAQDKLPLFRRDAGSVERLGFEFVDAAGEVVDSAAIDFGQLDADHFPFRLRQRPGPENALGQVKLVFPSPHDVYLHDTPSRSRCTRRFPSISTTSPP